MPDRYINKVIYGGNTLIDLTADTAEPLKVLSGYTFHDKSGTPRTGACDYDSNTTDATATASEILETRTAYVNAVKVTGTMPNRGAASGTISTKDGQYTIQNGFHDGSGKVGIDLVEKAKIIASNIKNGVTILGVTGNYSGESAVVQAKTVEAYTTQQVVLPDAGYDYLSQVTVKAISYIETDNLAGGKTVSIGLTQG